MTKTYHFDESTEQLYVNSSGPNIPPTFITTNASSKPNLGSSQGNQASHTGISFTYPPEMYVAETAENDVKSVNGETFYFSDASVRRGFIRKVFSIVSIQLTITMALICWFLFEKNTKKFIQTHYQLPLVAFALEIIVLLALFCFGELRRKTPTNYILLLLFTLSKGILIATVASFYDVLAVVLAVGFTTLVCVGLFIFATQTKWDFTTCGGLLFVSLLILIFFGISTIFLYSEIAQLIYATIGALIFSLYLVYDIQIMMGGKHRYQISSEEYVFAALNIYIDIVTIFIYILRIVGR